MRIAKILVFVIFFDGFFKLAFKYAKFVIIPVKKMNSDENQKITTKKLVSDVKKSGSKLDGFVIGEIKKPEKIKIAKIISKTIVKDTRVLKAIFWVRKITIAVKSIGKIAIGINKLRIKVPGKKASITTVNACAENENDAILAIHKKKPIINAKNPPNASLLKLYAPPDIGRLADNSLKFKAVKNINIPPRIRLIRTPDWASLIAEPSKIKIEPPIPTPIPYKIPVINPICRVGGIFSWSFSANRITINLFQEY